jgi:hypothetical protein
VLQKQRQERRWTSMIVDEGYHEVATPGSLSERLMIKTRDRIYADFLAACSPRPSDTILDVGVSDRHLEQ